MFLCFVSNNPPGGLLWPHCWLWVSPSDAKSTGDPRPGCTGPASMGKCLHSYLEPACLWIPIISLAAASHYSQIDHLHLSRRRLNRAIGWAGRRKVIKPFATVDAMHVLNDNRWGSVPVSSCRKGASRLGVQVKQQSIFQPKSSPQSILVHEMPKLTQALFRLQNLCSCSADIFETVLRPTNRRKLREKNQGYSFMHKTQPYN